MLTAGGSSTSSSRKSVDRSSGRRICRRSCEFRLLEVAVTLAVVKQYRVNALFERENHTMVRHAVKET